MNRVAAAVLVVSLMLFPSVPAGAAGGMLSASPGSVEFGNQRVGTGSVVRSFTLTNTAASTVTITAVSVVGDHPGDFFVKTADCLRTLNQNETCTVSVRFAPSARDRRVAQVSIANDGTEPNKLVNVAGTGTVGYYLSGLFGELQAFGDATDYGDATRLALNTNMIDMATHQRSGEGYWLLGLDGGVFSYNAPFFGSTGSLVLNSPVIGMAPVPVTGTFTGDGYWFVALDGGVFAYGQAAFKGSMGGRRLNEPVVAMAAHPSGTGYYLVASDGGIFAFDAPFFGSMGGEPLNSPIVGMAVTPSGNGYWLVALDGGVFAFGDAAYRGSMGGTRLNAEIVDMWPSPAGNGYWLAAADGGIFSFGDAPHLGSLGGRDIDDAISVAGTAPPQSPWSAPARTSL